MKKQLFAFLAGLFFLALTGSGCGAAKTLLQSGRLAGVERENGRVKALLLEEGPKTEYLVEIGKGTGFVSFVDGISAEDFKMKGAEDVHLTVYGKKGRRQAAEDGGTRTLLKAETVQIDGIYEPGAYQLRDGTSLDKMKGMFYDGWYLPDGFMLLKEDQPAGPAVFADPESPMLRYTDPRELEQIEAYYKDMGLLYDLPEELEKAYEAYSQTENKEDFSCFISQMIFASASAEAAEYYITIFDHPDYRRGAHHMREERYGAAFRTGSGERIETAELFKLPFAEAVEQILELGGAKEEEEDFREELRRALKPEYFSFSEKGLEITFPAGSLPDMEGSYILSLEREALYQIMKAEYVPRSERGV